jgi:hypothetical protein
MMKKTMDEPASRALRGMLGDDEIDPAGSRGTLARTLAKRQGISVRAARRQVRDLIRVGLEAPARGGKSIRRAWQRTVAILGGREPEAPSPDLAVLVTGDGESFTYEPDEDVAGIVVGVDESFGPTRREVVVEVAHVDGGLAGEITTDIKRKKPGQDGG